VAESPYIRIEEKSRAIFWIGFWGLVFFAIINVWVFLVFERDFFGARGFDRLLMQPSDNELQSVINKIKSDDDKKHIILLGDSVVWGVGVNDPKETIAGHLSDKLSDRSDVRVVNLAIPGNSFLDELAIIEALDDPSDAYVFFINPILFSDEYADRSFEEVVRFKRLVQRGLSGERNLFMQCCNLDIPAEMPQWVVSSFVFRALPLYHNRDLITKDLIGLQPSIAVDALIHRLRNFQILKAFERRPMEMGGGEVVSGGESPDFAESRMTRILREVSEILSDRPNIFYVVLNENRFQRGPEYRRSIRAVEKVIQSDNILNLIGEVRKDLYLDTVHMKPEGHGLVAGLIFQFLESRNAL